VDECKPLVQGGSEQFLTLTGSCVVQEAEAGKLAFSTNVRQTEKKSVSIKNTTVSAWTLKPTIQNDFWSGPEFLEVPAGKEAGPYTHNHPLFGSA
jgi:hydrocephalus-inducing protein